MISAADDNWLVVASNLEGVRVVWKTMTRILNREGAEPRVSGFFFKAVVQVGLLFSLETWVVIPYIGRALVEFQDQVALQLTGRLLWRETDGKWKYTSAAAAREEAGFQTMEKYIR